MVHHLGETGHRLIQVFLYLTVDLRHAGTRILFTRHHLAQHQRHAIVRFGSLGVIMVAVEIDQVQVFEGTSYERLAPHALPVRILAVGRGKHVVDDGIVGEDVFITVVPDGVVVTGQEDVALGKRIGVAHLLALVHVVERSIVGHRPGRSIRVLDLAPSGETDVVGEEQGIHVERTVKRLTVEQHLIVTECLGDHLALGLVAQPVVACRQRAHHAGTCQVFHYSLFHHLSVRLEV